MLPLVQCVEGQVVEPRLVGQLAVHSKVVDEHCRDGLVTQVHLVDVAHPATINDVMRRVHPVWKPCDIPTSSNGRKWTQEAGATQTATSAVAAHVGQVSKWPSICDCTNAL